MARDNPVSRRTALKLTGAAASTALIAGCSSDDGNGNGNGNGGGASEYEAEPEDEIHFEATTGDWTGIKPSEIEGSSNPTLILEEGETYYIGWTEGNNTEHNIEIWDENDEVVEEYETEEVSEPDDDQILEVTATSDMVAYVCDPHSSQMHGEIQVE
ncbi:twin-arginine translocation signal domain-containing protein [Natrinema versiforme]|uniref:PKD domain-containing protein n=1 Tax=Natrinema versiforme TaxID=88724 RepID=A0A4V1FXA0_9EURY|nr:twin-arginine translocation signal domain-containing protein [Natrinema versiforme]QCS40901.1 PKD domain-containing protein [Natrinema versiforme]